MGFPTWRCAAGPGIVTLETPTTARTTTTTTTHARTHTHPSKVPLSHPPIRARPHVAQLEHKLLQAAGKAACRRAIQSLRPHVQKIMRNKHAKPLTELLDEPLQLNVADRHCMTTDDILKWGGGILRRRRRVPRAPDNEESLESILARRPPAPLPPEQEPLEGYDSEDW